MTDDRDLRDLLDGDDQPPRPGFRSELRRHLSDEWNSSTVTPSAGAARRPRWSIGVAAAAALALVVAGLAWIAGEGGAQRIAPPADTDAIPSSTAPMPDTTAPEVPVSPPSSTPEPAVTEPPAAAPFGQPLAAWVQVQADAGRAQITFTAGDHTDAQLVRSSLGGIPQEEAVLLTDLQVVVPAPSTGVGLFGLGGRLVFVGHDDADQPAVWVLDASSGEWQPGPTLGVTTAGPANLEVRLAGDVLLVTRNRYVARPDDGVYEPVERIGVRMFADLTTAPISTPPDGIPISWTSAAGGKALLMGRDTAAGVDDPLLSPWAYDPVADTWSEVSDPEWLSCPDSDCAWPRAHERGDPSLELETPAGLVQRIPDGTVGLLDPATLTWRRLDDAPFDLAGHLNFVAGDPFVVSVPIGQGSGIEVGTEIGVLTVADGTWRTYDVLPEPLPAMWESKQTPAGLVLRPIGEGVDTWLAVDTTTGAPRVASASDNAAWGAALAGGTYGVYTPAELLAILGARPDTQPTSTEPCFAGLDGEAAATAFVDALVAARFRGTTAAPCVDGAPEQFTGTAGACWEECTPRTFARSAVSISDINELDGSVYWSVSLPVTYLNLPTGWTYIDVIENWQLRPDGVGWVAELGSIEPPLPTREASLDTANAYLAAIADQDWLTAAELMSVGGADLGQRADMQQLAPDDFTIEGVAAALGRWCAVDCDASPATVDDLTFDGGYALARKGQELRISWYEGMYGVDGVPPSAFAPEDGPDLLAGWPDAPAPPDNPLDDIPYLVPTSPMPGADGAVSRESVWPLDTASYSQMWLDPNDPSVVIQVDTYPGQSAFRQNTRAVVAPGWDDPRATWSSSGRVNLSLGEPGGYVTVAALGVSEWELLDLVAGMARNATGPGWELADANLQPVADGWYSGFASRTIRWPDAELTIARAGTELFDTAQQFATAARPVDLVRGPGVVFESDGLTAVAWNVTDDVTALFGYRGTVDETLSIVNGLVSTSRQGWLEFAAFDASPADGCDSLFC